jgi:hypothetical protein
LSDRVETFEAHLDTPEDVEPILSAFEDKFFETTGRRLESSAFYDLYCAGEFDTPMGVAWATYYEAYREFSARRAGDFARVVPPIAAAC